MLTNTCLALLGLPGGSEIIIIGIIALLLFGSRLPKVARSMGKSIVEFKKGIKGIDDEINAEANRTPTDQIEGSDDPAKISPDPNSEVEEVQHPQDD